MSLFSINNLIWRCTLLRNNNSYASYTWKGTASWEIITMRRNGFLIQQSFVSGARDSIKYSSDRAVASQRHPCMGWGDVLFQRMKLMAAEMIVPIPCVTPGWTSQSKPVFKNQSIIHLEHCSTGLHSLVIGIVYFLFASLTVMYCTMDRGWWRQHID